MTPETIRLFGRLSILSFVMVGLEWLVLPASEWRLGAFVLRGLLLLSGVGFLLAWEVGRIKRSVVPRNAATAGAILPAKLPPQGPQCSYCFEPTAQHFCITHHLALCAKHGPPHHVDGVCQYQPADAPRPPAFGV